MEREFRYERKYYIDTGNAELLKMRVSSVLKPDSNSNGQYKISSLYFDDLYNSSFYHKQNGVLVRDKMRLRYYNNSLGFIRLERKFKYGEMVSKDSAKITTEEYNAMRNCDYSFMQSSNQPLLQQFYAHNMVKPLRPVVNVVYDRTAFVYTPGNVRITFDENLMSGKPHQNIAIAALPANVTILEVKYDHFIPSIVQELLSGVPLTQISISKFVISSLLLQQPAI